MSPRGTWIHYTQLRDVGMPTYMEAAVNLKTGEYREWFLKHYQSAFWIDDFRYVGIDLVGSVPTYEVHDLRAGSAVTALSVLEAGTINGRRSEPQPLNKGVSFVRNSRAVITRRWFDKRSGTIVEKKDEIGLAPSLESAWQNMNADWEYKNPNDWIDSSPSHSVLLHLGHSTTAPIRVWLHQFIPAIDANPVKVEGLWINPRSGGELVEVGHVLAVPGQAGYFVGQLTQIQWLPDGRRVSFIYHGQLYTIPIPASE